MEWDVVPEDHKRRWNRSRDTLLMKHSARDISNLASLAQVVCELWPTKVEIAILASQVIVCLVWSRKNERQISEANWTCESEWG